VSQRPLTWLGIATIAAILGATILATVASIGAEQDDAHDRREQVVSLVVNDLADRITAAATSVHELKAVVEASGDLSADGFQHVAAVPLADQPSLTTLTWSRLRAGDDLAAAEPVAIAPAGASADGAGRNPLSVAAVRSAAAAAVDDGDPQMSAPVDAPGGGREVFLVAPVFAPGAPVGDAAARRAALRGVVTGTLDPDSLGEELAGTLPDGARLRVTDGDAPLIGGSGVTSDGDPGALGIAGRDLTVDVAGTGGASNTMPIAIALGGLLLATVVGLLFWESGNRERAALAVAATRSAESREARAALRHLTVRHELILASAGDGIIGVDRDGQTTFVNAAAARMLGRPGQDLEGRPAQALGLPWLAAALAAGEPRGGEEDLRRPDGSNIVAEHLTTPIVEDGETIGAVITFRDVTERRERDEARRRTLAAAEERAAVDPLTGLANHRTFHERLRAEVEGARRRKRGLALVLMDLDHFKRVNDEHGHQVGDRVLQHAAQVLAAETRAGELVARVGGEEFAMILPEADADEALQAAERVRRGVSDAHFPTVGRMTMSAGVCDISQAADADALYRLADGALYWAKHHGRDVVMRYSPEITRALSAQEQAERLERQQALVSIRLLARVVDAKDPSTRRHSERVAALCEELADALGWSPERCRLLGDAGLVHDVGKIGVPDAILFKPARLTPEEYDLVKEHAELGARIVSEALTPEQVTWVRSHHERWGGGGYPAGLMSESIPEGARIMAVADAWDVMTSERPYTAGPATTADAIAECRVHSGTQFWPPAVEALVAIRGGTE
jgi:diguanylate cyclase (GGDEF)-like protein/PAS domain S-box-containing protein/putative nucleotidyltransferase with HDIG domain